MALHLYPVSDATSERAPLIEVRLEYWPEPVLRDPAYVLANQVQDLLTCLRHFKEPAPGGGHLFHLARIEHEVFALNRTLTKIRRTAIFPTDMSFALFRGWKGSEVRS